MAIKAERHMNYGGTAVTQKYSPLHNITYTRTDESVYSKLLTNRLDLLVAANILPQPLRLVTDWEKALSRGAPDPPLVVISSNRSNWIATGLRVAKDQKTITEYEGSNDLEALTGKVRGQTQSPPLYAPARLEGDRRIFIVVHENEYATYRAVLSSDIIVVGWSFRTPPTSPAELTGFGASRYAAMEFCKYARANKTGAPWDYAWLLDDNVVGITRFPGFKVVEDAIKATKPTQVCAAFQGGAGVEGFTKTKDWASGEVNATPSRRKPTVLDPTTTPVGIIQQAALWNIAYFTEQKLNFSPLFVASGEDVSLGNFFNLVIPDRTTEPREPGKPAVPYLYYGSSKVWKEEIPRHDDSDGAKAVSRAREKFQKWFAAQESEPTPPGDTAPPPVSIESGEGATATVKTLKVFIDEWFKPKSKPKPTEGAAAVATEDTKEQDKAKCQAVEQITCGAIKEGYVSKAALNRTFKIPHEAPQVIDRRRPARP